MATFGICCLFPLNLSLQFHSFVVEFIAYLDLTNEV